jgi:hypothetical protein
VLERIDLLLYQLQQEASGGPGAARGGSETALLASTIFDVCMTIARLAFATAVGSLLGGSVIAVALGEPLFDKAFEGAVGGLLGGFTSETNNSGTAWANRLRAQHHRSAHEDCSISADRTIRITRLVAHRHLRYSIMCIHDSAAVTTIITNSIRGVPRR